MTEGNRPSGNRIFRTAILITLGGVLAGIDRLSKIAQEENSDIDNVEEGFDLSTSLADSVPENKRTRYLIIGGIVRSSQAVYKLTSQTIQSASDIAHSMTDFLSPVTNSWLFRPIANRWQGIKENSQDIVEEWIEEGIRSEKSSLDLVHRTADRTAGDLIHMVAERPEVQDLVQQQSVGMVQEVTDELQGRTAAADSLLERIIFKLLPGAKKDTTPTVVVPILDEEEQ
jgi:hypothetical protein